MNLTRRSLLSLVGLGAATGLAACQNNQQHSSQSAKDKEEEAPQEQKVDLEEFEDLALDMGNWQYDETNDCYYQLALPYCITPGSEQYESLAIFVPGPYFTAKKKGDHYECTIDETAQVGSFTPATAPIAIPVNSPTCSAQECPTTYSYDGLGRYLQAGIVYVYAGFRGRSGGYESTTQEYFSGGAPWVAADLKAAVRYLRYNAGVLPANTKRIFMFGLGAGAGVAALLGTSGGATSYEPYLNEIGSATHDVLGNELSDAINGVAAWCPMGSYQTLDAAYEWMMGQYSSKGTRADGTWTKLLSSDLATAYGEYVNQLELVDAEGTQLRLDRIEDGTYAGGTYYDYLVSEIDKAAEDFFERTAFPYTALPPDERERFFPGNPMLGAAGSVEAPVQETSDASESGSPTSGVRRIEATVYETLESYITTLNGGNRWLTYNSATGEAYITGLWGFAMSCRQPSKDVCAYDMIDRSGLANQLFGTSDQPSLHFDSVVAKLVEAQRERYAQGSGWNEELVAEWRGDLAEKDSLEMTVAQRVVMSNPLAFLKGEAGEEKVKNAAHWRINTGLFQSETTLVGEANLALALAASKGVKDVQFQPVWGAGFGFVEREGDPEDNLVAWILSCCPDKSKKENS